jgi:predicted O-linked N-acetylglucosamine transferase (SPINDLY family)
MLASELFATATSKLNLGDRNGALGYIDQAAESIGSQEIFSVQDIQLVLHICSYYFNLQKQEQAYEFLDLIHKKNPQNLDLYRARAILLRGIGRAQEALPIFKELIRINPLEIDSIIAVANTYQFIIGDKVQAAHYYNMGLNIAPNNLELLQSYCSAVVAEGGGDNLTKGYELAIKIINLAPSVNEVAGIIQSLSLRVLDYELYSKIATDDRIIDNWVNNLDISPLLFRMARVKTLEDKIKLVDYHRIYGKQREAVSDLKPIKRQIPRSTSYSKIRLGLLSSDLRGHPVGFFVWPLINYLDPKEFEIYCYSSYPFKADKLQEYFSSKVASYKVSPGIGSNELAQNIYNDGIDVLLELGGPTSFSRHDVCTYRPAPLQISWLGYPNSLGFPKSIDYLMLDPYINPTNPALIIEKPMIMPNSWVCIDPQIFPTRSINNTIPEDRNGFITIGTLNAPYKLTPQSFAVWAEIMQQFPNSKFLYGRLEANSKAMQNNFIKHMAAHGIDSDRLIFFSEKLNYIDCYNNIDVAVDTFPHTGGTTTCEALWMGVPVVTLVGEAFYERISYSNLNNAGLADLCAFNVNEYKHKLIELLKNKERRRYLRNQLRNQIVSNPLGKPQQFAADFAIQIRTIRNNGNINARAS